MGTALQGRLTVFLDLAMTSRANGVDTDSDPAAYRQLQEVRSWSGRCDIVVSVNVDSIGILRASSISVVIRPVLSVGRARGFQREIAVNKRGTRSRRRN